MYPYDTTTSGLTYDHKLTLRFSGGYINTNNVAAYGYNPYQLLWADTLNNLVVLKMPPNPSGYMENLF